MRRIPVKFLREGSLIARNIYDKNGVLLISKGYEIDSQLIILLKKHNILSVYINDEYSPSISDDVINPELRLKSILELKRMYYSFFKIEEKNDDDLVKCKYFERIKELVIDIVDELLSIDKLLIEGTDIRNYENYFFSHLVNVAVMSISLGIKLKYSREKLIKLGLAAILYDIGLVFLPNEILYKTTKRTFEEEKIFRTHCQKGYDFLYEFENIDEEILEVALCHHEKVNGKGYPKGLSGNKISDFTKIISIIDFYDELTSVGIMIEENNPNDVLEMIIAYVESYFSYEFVNIFYQIVVPFPKGTIIKLSNDDICLIEETINGFPLRPVVKIIKSEDESKINKCINLVDNLSLNIVKIVYYI